MKNLRLITLVTLILVVAIGLQAQAASYTYVDTGYAASRWTPHTNALDELVFTGNLGAGDTVLVYDIASSSITNLGNPASAYGTYALAAGITDDGRVAARSNDSYGYSWFYDPTAGWVRSWNSRDQAEDVSQTHVVVANQGAIWYADFASIFANASSGIMAPGDRNYAGYPHPEDLQAPNINNNTDIVASDMAWSDGYLLTGGAGSYSAIPLVGIGMEINDSQVIAGHDASYNGFVYDYVAGGGAPAMVSIPFLPGMDTVIPESINNSGVVVGRQTDSVGSYGTRAFIWDAANSTRDLNDPLVVSGILDYPGDDPLYRATQITDGGLITGTTKTGHMFVLLPTTVPPTPKNRGDVTEDLFVGADDLVRILTHWGESGPAVTWSDGDCAPYGDGITTGDQFVGADDYVEVLSMWGTSYPAEPTPTPEPATLGLLLLGGLAMLRRRK